MTDASNSAGNSTNPNPTLETLLSDSDLLGEFDDSPEAHDALAEQYDDAGFFSQGSTYVPEEDPILTRAEVEFNIRELLELSVDDMDQFEGFNLTELETFLDFVETPTRGLVIFPTPNS